MPAGAGHVMLYTTFSEEKVLFLPFLYIPPRALH